MDKLTVHPDVIVKPHGKNDVTLASLELDTIFRFEGDVALLLYALSDNRGEGLSKSEIVAHLDKSSKSFRTNPKKQEALNEGLKFLMSKGLVVEVAQ